VPREEERAGTTTDRYIAEDIGEGIMFAGGEPVPPISPADVAAVRVWIEPRLIGGFLDGQNVGAFNELSPNAYPFTGLAVYQTDEINGHAVFRANGTTHAFASTGAIPAIANWKLWIVAKPLNIVNNQYFLGAGSDNRAIILGFTDGEWAYYNGAASKLADANTGAFQLIKAPAGASANAAWKLFAEASGSSFPWGGDFAGLIAADADTLTPEQETGLDLYVQQNFAL
jgi:hypothetical protein